MRAVARKIDARCLGLKRAKKVNGMKDSLRDLKQSLRVLLINPEFTLAALAALALGIGANTAVFSLVNTVLLRPLNAPGSDRMVELKLSFRGRSGSGGSAHQFYYRKQQTEIF